MVALTNAKRCFSDLSLAVSSSFISRSPLSITLTSFTNHALGYTSPPRSFFAISATDGSVRSTLVLSCTKRSLHMSQDVLYSLARHKYSLQFE